MPIIHLKNGRKHSCLPRHFYSSFRNDGSTAGPSRGESEDDEVSSGGEVPTDDETEESLPLQHSVSMNHPQASFECMLC